MAELVEPVKKRILDQSVAHASVGGFSCGSKGKTWEASVNTWADRVHRGATTSPQTIVALEDAEGKLIGLSGVKPGVLFPALYRKPLVDVPYVHMIGTDYRFHGVRLADGSSPGDALLRASLEQIRTDWGGGNLLPHVWALVNPKNRSSHALFDRNGFGEISATGKGDAIRLRVPRPLDVR
jgi:hypothetical protein